MANDKQEALNFIASLDSSKYEVIRMYAVGEVSTCHWEVEYRALEAETEEHTHSWTEKDMNGKNVTMCEECGTIEEDTSNVEHSHVWDVKEVEGEIIAFCKECGKMAE